MVTTSELKTTTIPGILLFGARSNAEVLSGYMGRELAYHEESPGFDSSLIEEPGQLTLSK